MFMCLFFSRTQSRAKTYLLLGDAQTHFLTLSGADTQTAVLRMVSEYPLTRNYNENNSLRIIFRNSEAILYPQNIRERRTFQGIAREIRNFSKIIILEWFFVSNNFVSEGTVWCVFPVLVFQLSKQQNRTWTTSSTVLGTPPNRTRTKRFPLEELCGGCSLSWVLNWESTENWDISPPGTVHETVLGHLLSSGIHRWGLDLSTGYPNTYFSWFSGYPPLTLVFLPGDEKFRIFSWGACHENQGLSTSSV